MSSSSGYHVDRHLEKRARSDCSAVLVGSLQYETSDRNEDIKTFRV